MEFHVFLAVLGAALCHAAWNAAIKLRIDPAVAVTLIAVTAAVPGLPIVLVTPWPAAATWPYLAASTVVHLAYHLAMAEAYRTGALSQVYPISRGSAPLLTAVTTSLVFGDHLGPAGWGGVLLLTSGVLLLSLPANGRLSSLDRRAVGFALVTAIVIAVYTVIDGQGARVSGHPLAYVAWFFVLDGAMMGLWGWWRQRVAIAAVPWQGLALAIVGGVLAFTSYGIALWAMTKAPIALVAALRETSVLFAAALGVVLLKEPLVAARVIAAVLVVAGLALIRLG